MTLEQLYEHADAAIEKLQVEIYTALLISRLTKSLFGRHPHKGPERNNIMSNFNFKAAASKELSLSPLMENREKIETDELYNKELTVIAFDFITTKDPKDGMDKTYPVVNFEELPDKFYLGGALLAKVFQVWAAEFDGDFEECSNALAESGGVKFRFVKGKTRSGNNITKIEVV